MALKPFCNSCGKCCQTMGVWVEMAKSVTNPTPEQKAMAAFPHSYDKNGRCEKLSDQNECSIYDERPDICSIEKIHDRFYKHMSKAHFYEISKQACIDLGATRSDTA